MMAALTGNSRFSPPQLLLTVLFCVSGFMTSHSFDITSVDNIVRAVQACHAESNLAMAVTVVKDGRVLLSHGYGVTSIQGNELVNGSTRFGIASLSKAFTATLLLKVMEEDGRYNLSTKIRDILGYSFRFEDELRTKEATVEDLLSHKIAIPSNNRIRFDSTLTRANVQHRFQHLKSPEAFRNVYIYSNLMYGVATHITEVIGQASWEDLLRRHLFQPLGMKRSTFAKDVNARESGLAQPFENYYGKMRRISPRLSYYWSELAGSGAVVSTADDMARWLNFHLSKGTNKDKARIVPQKTMEELYKPRTAMPSSTTSKFRRPDVPVTLSYDVYGMGWRTGYYRGYPILGHGGSTFGYRALLTLLPSRQLGVFTVMTGKDISYAVRGTLHAYLLDHALGVQPWLNVSSLCSFPAPWHNVSAPAKGPAYAPEGLNRYQRQPLLRNVSAYVGSYEHPAYGRVVVKAWKDTVGGDRDDEDDGREPSAPLTIFYGYGTWDLVPLPAPTSSSSSSSSSSGSSEGRSESFFGKGRNVTAWVDYSPFVFHAPPTGSDVVVKLSIPGFEKKLPPVFTRVEWSGTSGGSGLAAGLIHCLLGVLVVVLSWKN